MKITLPNSYFMKLYSDNANRTDFIVIYCWICTDTMILHLKLSQMSFSCYCRLCINEVI